MENKASTLDSEFYRNADVFFAGNLPTALTYDDISLACNYSEVLPHETELETSLSETVKLHIPIVSSDMDTVTEAPMAIAMALNGGLGLIHYNMPDKSQVKEVARVKNHVHGLIQEPIKVSPEQLIGDVLQRIAKSRFAFSTFPVVDRLGKLLGLLQGSVLKPRYRNHTVAEAMTNRGELITISDKEIEDDPIGTADRFFSEHIGIHKLLVVDDQDRLRGLFTLSDIERISEEFGARLKPARDSKFRLVCGAAVAARRSAGDTLDRQSLVNQVHQLVEEGLDVVAVSTAHGHTASVGEAVQVIRDEFEDLAIIAGNVTTAEGVDFLADCGADSIKVGQGPGSICTTRLVAGVGIPQLTALYAAAQIASRRGLGLLADGGITKSGDMVKALTLADAVVCGSLLAGCTEAPGRIVDIDGKLYKQYRGMGSFVAMKSGAAARYGRDSKDAALKAAPEGIEALKEVSGSLDENLHEFVGGIQAGMGYLGARNLSELKRRARYIRVTPAGQRESAPHDVVEIKATQK